MERDDRIQILVDLDRGAAALGAFGAVCGTPTSSGSSPRESTRWRRPTTRMSTPRLCTDRRAPVPVTAARRGIERGVLPFHVAAGPRFGWVPARRSCSPATSTPASRHAASPPKSATPLEHGGSGEALHRPASRGRIPGPRPWLGWEYINLTGEYRLARCRPHVASGQLDELMSVLQRGDRLVVSELSRLGRSLGQITERWSGRSSTCGSAVAVRRFLEVLDRRLHLVGVPRWPVGVAGQPRYSDLAAGGDQPDDRTLRTVSGRTSPGTAS